MLTLALNTDDTLVIDDYYKEGKGINLQLVKVQEAKAKGIKTELRSSGNTITLRFISGQPDSGEALSLAFHHATLAKNDFELLLSKDATGTYRARLEKPLSGKWHMTLLPLSGQWKVSNPIVFPQSSAIAFNP